VSIKQIKSTDISSQAILLAPEKTYTSSSLSGTNDSVFVFPTKSKREKESKIQTTQSSSLFAANDSSEILSRIKQSISETTDVLDLAKSYINSIHNLPESSRKQRSVDVLRFVPDYSLTKNTKRKQFIENNLFRYWNKELKYLNYHSLNFVSCSTLPKTKTIIFPQVVGQDPITTKVTGSWLPTGSFTFDFWLKPHKTMNASSHHPGTILHMSSTYAISIVSGSDKNPDTTVSGFRILLQLSSSANIQPSNINLNSLPDFCFLSEDNTLRANVWHNITIRWGTKTRDFGTGSIKINQNETKFVLNETSITPASYSPDDSPSTLFVGNYYKGSNGGANTTSMFFSTPVSNTDGLRELFSTVGSETEPAGFTLDFPLHAELQEIKIYNQYLSDFELENNETKGLIFNLPPVFQEHTQQRQVLISPFQSEEKETTQPFSIDLGFGFNSYYLNLENFTQDTVSLERPRLYALSASVISSPSNARTVDDLLFSSGSVVARNMLIMPSDNGNGKIFATGSNQYISLRNMVSTSSLTRNIRQNSTASIQSAMLGSIDLSNAGTLTNTSSRYFVAEETKCGDSNLVVIFDISSLFYGKRIKPGSLTLTNTNFSGSAGSYSVVLKDDGYGNIYKHVLTGSSATWNDIGSIFYDEGLIYIKHPSLYTFGETDFTINFKGEQNLYSYTIDCEASGDINKTFNPTYMDGMEIDDDYDERNKKFVFLNELLIHDENLNIIGRTKLAQPIAKRTGEKIIIRFKYDI
jgi:hypothetical protein